ncbi:MAG: Stp1/IreP family PP2C-type Ser/Thr phosphatase [Acidimicrobiia bacterium]
MRYQWATATHKGRVRANNQDSVHPAAAGSSDDVALLIVADGMGGHVAGEVASRIAIDAALDFHGRAPGLDVGVSERVDAANRAILAEVARRPELAGMGTTITMVELHPTGVGIFAHVGDSRAYLLRDGTLRQLTEDHTIVNEYLRSGKITEDQAAEHPQRHMITRALGLIPDVEVDVFDLELASGDRLLLCSDGVNGMIDDASIRQALLTPTAEEAVWELVERANGAGGHDNVTAVVVDVA